MIIKTFGLICLNLSIIAFGPKSAEHEDHIAPIFAVAKNEIIVSGILGKIPTIRSPLLILIFLKNLIFLRKMKLF